VPAASQGDNFSDALIKLMAFPCYVLLGLLSNSSPTALHSGHSPHSCWFALLLHCGRSCGARAAASSRPPRAASRDEKGTGKIKRQPERAAWANRRPNSSLSRVHFTATPFLATNTKKWTLHIAWSADKCVQLVNFLPHQKWAHNRTNCFFKACQACRWTRRTAPVQQRCVSVRAAALCSPLAVRALSTLVVRPIEHCHRLFAPTATAHTGQTGPTNLSPNCPRDPPNR